MDENDKTTRELIIAWRGGVPSKCDFCDHETPESDLHPEEGGQWACIKCIRRWDDEEREAAKGKE